MIFLGSETCSFKPDRKNYNKKVFHSIKEIKKKNNIKQKDIYIEVQSPEKFNDSYKQKWESMLNNTSLNWNDVWTNIHQTKIGLDIKSAICSQIHLGYFKRGAAQSVTCNLCHETLQ